jgi:hypothetical protein
MWIFLACMKSLGRPKSTQGCSAKEEEEEEEEEE